MNDNSISFVDTECRELFRIPDGGSIKITYPISYDREPVICKCEYIDEVHIRVNGTIYHRDEFAENMNKLGAKYEPEQRLEGIEAVAFAPETEKYYSRNREDSRNIGQLSGQFGSSGQHIKYGWTEHNPKSNTARFRSEMYGVINELRKDVLKDRDSMIEYCQKHPESTIISGTNYRIHGFEVNTDSRKYYLSCFIDQYTNDTRFTIYPYNSIAREKAVRHEKITNPRESITAKPSMKTPKRKKSRGSER